MSDEISLLPENLRKKEQELKNAESKLPPQAPSVLKFSNPAEEADDVEVIEVDEGEVDQVLAGEPALAKLAYRVTTFFEGLKDQLFAPREIEPPPKVPPQFFTPPPLKPKPLPAAAPVVPKPLPPVGTPSVPPVPMTASSTIFQTPTSPPAVPKTKAQIKPFATAPRRVRVIKRIRKPLRVSFVSEEEMRLLRVDIPRRRFTFVTMAALFSVLIGGGYVLLHAQLSNANDGLNQAKSQLAEVHAQITEKQKTWAAFQDLEPKLKTLSAVLDQHLSPTRLLGLIEANTLPTVAYGSFALTPDRRVSLSVTADSLESAAKQVVAFQKADFVKSVEASSYALTYGNQASDLPQAVQFQVSLVLSPSALNQPVASPAN